MSLLPQFIAVIKQERLFAPHDHLILAVSGGVDSVVLCELCHQAGYNFTMAHCNFQLRGEESNRDEEFVRNLEKKYNKEVVVKRFDTEQYAKDHKLSIQEAARELRYMWFEKLVGEAIQNSKFKIQNQSGTQDLPIHHSPFTIHLLTAHHANDNNETLLMNFFRGTGLHGLTGIPASNGYIKRPLLSFTRENIMQFAAENKIAWVEDSSNTSAKYTRNFLRHELLPAISTVYPQVNQNLQDNISRFTEIEKLYKLLVERVRQKLCLYKGKEIHIPVNGLLKYNNRALVYELIAPYGFQEKQVDEVLKLARSESGKYIQSPGNTHRIIKHRLWFIISPIQPGETTNIVLEEGVKEMVFAGGKLLIRETSAKLINQNDTAALLDAKFIEYPLLLRRWKTGDYFYPLGMKKKKKISRFLIDNKLSKTEKENTWVMESGGRIIWVVGRRIDERFKVSDKTRKAVSIILER
jgi:tRNA(Ile)-lysidine synthase